jgi:transketolase
LGQGFGNGVGMAIASQNDEREIGENYSVEIIFMQLPATEV